MPFPPRLCGCKTTTTTTHVSEGCLTRTMSSSTTNTGDTSDCSSCSPGFSGCLPLALFVGWGGKPDGQL
jgi:hypothetical protein